MSTPNGELQIIRHFNFSFKDDNSGIPNAPNLVPIPPSYIRDVRYKGDTRYAIPLANNALTLTPSSQGDSGFDHCFTGSPLQFGVRLFSMTLHATVWDSFLPKAFVSIPGMDRFHSPRRQTLRLQYHRRWYFYRHRGLCCRSSCCGAAGKLPHDAQGSCR